MSIMSKAHTAQEALDFILHAYFNSDIVNANNENTQFVLFSCQSDDGKDSGEYMAIRNGNGFDIMDISAIPYRHQTDRKTGQIVCFRYWH